MATVRSTIVTSAMRAVRRKLTVVVPIRRQMRHYIRMLPGQQAHHRFANHHRN